MSTKRKTKPKPTPEVVLEILYKLFLEAEREGKVDWTGICLKCSGIYDRLLQELKSRGFEIPSEVEMWYLLKEAFENSEIKQKVAEKLKDSRVLKYYWYSQGIGLEILVNFFN